MTVRAQPPRRTRALALAASFLAFVGLPARAADPAPFDLTGPGLKVTVTRGDKTLPIGQVPSLVGGDRLSISAELPDDQRTPYLLVSAFLDGATNPPPTRWFETAETWKRKDKDRLLTLTVPDGARQLILFLVPQTGGASNTIAKAVRGKPGEFVRASQALNRASLDRSRLDAFVAAIRAQENTHPEYLRTIAPTLARSLTLKLNDECLAKVIEQQAACLLENREALVLADVHSSSVAETLIGAPADLALQLSYTREGGLGYYSPYIAVVRDLARVFGAFSNPQFSYLPTLSIRENERVSLLLNTAPSFAKPKSVLVVGMPNIGNDSPPQLRNAGDGPICGARPDLVLPVEGAPLVFSTGYAHDMAARITAPSGLPLDLPVAARADRAGYVLTDSAPLAGARGTIKARLHGLWGYDRFDGPEFTLQFPDGQAWRAEEDTSLVVGRDNGLLLAGPAPACVQNITMRVGDSAPRPVDWKLTGEGVSLTLPLREARPGEVTLEIRQHGTPPAAVKLRAYRQASRLDALAVHGGDDWAVLSGQRLDQVASVELAGVQLLPGELSREGEIDRLRLAATPSGKAPATGTASVKLTDGRTLNLPVTIAAPRPQVALLSKSLASKQPTSRFDGFSEALLPDNARLDFSVRANDATRLLPSDAIEIATQDEQARVTLASGKGVRLESARILVASFDPAALGASVSGPLKFRLVRGDQASDWQPLATLARLPRIDAVECTSGAAATCTLRGEALYLIDSVLPGQGEPVAVPAGFTGRMLQIPAPADGKLRIRLRDAPEQTVVLRVA